MLDADPTRAAAVAAGYPFVHLFELRFGAGTQRFASWGHDLTWDGETWIGTGAYDTLSPLSQGSGSDTVEMSMIFSGIDADLLDDISNDSRGKLMVWRIGVLSGLDSPDVAGVWEFLSQRMSPGTIISDRGALTVELRLRPPTDIARVRAISTYSHSQQQAIDPNDYCCIDSGVILELNRSEYVQKSGF